MDEQNQDNQNNQDLNPVKPVDGAQSNPPPTYMAPPTSNMPYVASVPTNSLAIVSLVSSILSWVILPVVGGIVGLITGIMARKEIKQSNGAQGGDGFATVGIIVSAINIVVMCLAITCIGGLIFAGIASKGFTR